MFDLGYGNIECPKCKSKAKVVGMTYVTTMGWSPGYYDEKGEFHGGVDPNTTTQEFTCSNCGHHYSVSSKMGVGITSVK